MCPRAAPSVERGGGGPGGVEGASAAVLDLEEGGFDIGFDFDAGAGVAVALSKWVDRKLEVTVMDFCLQKGKWMNIIVLLLQLTVGSVRGTLKIEGPGNQGGYQAQIWNAAVLQSAGELSY